VTEEQRLVLAWAILFAVVLWSYLWKCFAFWKAAQRNQVGWYVIIALAPPFGIVEMIYTFWISSRVGRIDEMPL